MAKKKDSTVKLVEVDKIRFYPEVNRELDQAWVDHLVANWNPDAIGIPVLSERSDGSFAILDGHHRIEAFRTVNAPINGHRARAQVWTGLSESEEADRFVRLNTNRGVKAIDKYDKAVRAGWSTYVGIEAVLRRHKLRVQSGDSDGIIQCVAQLVRIYDRYGERHLDKTLSLAIAAWGRTTATVQGSVIAGLSLFLGRQVSVDEEVLVKKMRAFPGGPSGIIGRARGSQEVHGSSIPNNIAAILTVTYNKSRGRNKLPDWWAR